MMYESIGFQGQGIRLCNQIPNNNDNKAHGAILGHNMTIGHYAEMVKQA